MHDLVLNQVDRIEDEMDKIREVMQKRAIGISRIDHATEPARNLKILADGLYQIIKDYDK